MITYVGPYPIEQLASTKYWYPVIIEDAGGAEHIRYKLDAPTTADTCMLSDNNIDSYAYPLFASKYVVTSQMKCLNND